jgi:hypothetical protein
VDHFEPGSEGCRREVEVYVTNEDQVSRGLDPALARRVAEFVIPRYKEQRKTLPPDPRDWGRK